MDCASGIQSAPASRPGASISAAHHSTQAADRKPSPGRIPELDGLRGLAILLVVIWHYFGAGTITARIGSPAAYGLAMLRLSWSGVDLFFVLSGFLIGGILLDARESETYFRTFYFRRAYRILPLYFAWCLLFAAGVYLTAGSQSMPLTTLFNQRLPLWSYPLFIQNTFMTLRRDFGAEWMGITWSLAIEEQFYLLLPLAVRFLKTATLRRVVIAAIICAPAFRLLLFVSGNTFIGPYVLLPCRADALGLGVLLALAARDAGARDWLLSHRRQTLYALLVLGAGVGALLLLRGPLWMVGMGYSWIAAFYATLLLRVVIVPERKESFLFRTKLLVQCGTFAYAIYLLHQGVNALYFNTIYGSRPFIRDLPTAALTGLSIGTVLLLSGGSWRLIEKPLMRTAHSKYSY